MKEERIGISEHTYSPKVGVIIPTYKPGKKFSRLLKVLGLQTHPVGRIIVMNTEKAYWNDKGHQGILSMETHHLLKIEFDHGATRNRGVRYNRADIIAFMTDDAVPTDECLIGHLVGALRQRGPQRESMIMVYARQLPDEGCPMAEHYTRSFNCPKESCTKTGESLERMRIKIFFASNACCACDREKFWLQGGSIAKTVFNEDMIFASRTVLQDDYAIAYVVEAGAIHSYNYGCAAWFRRNSNLTVSQIDHPEVFADIRSESGGIHLVEQIAGHLVEIRRPWLIPGMIAKSGFKYIGYWAGRCYRTLPKSLAVKCSMNKEYQK